MRLRRKIATLAAASVMPLFVMPDAMAGVSCIDGVHSDIPTSGSMHVNDGSLGKDEWWFKAGLWYRYCLNTAGYDWGVPKKLMVSYNWEGSTMSCAWDAFQRLEYVQFNPVYTDGLGREKNPRAIRLPCKSDTTDVGFQRYLVTKRLYYVEITHANGSIETRFPELAVRVDVQRDGILNDGYMGTMHGHMHRALVIDF